MTVGAVVLLTVLWLTMMLTGTGEVDRSLLHALYAADRPALRSFALGATVFGEWQAVILLSLVGAASLLHLGKVRSAVLLLAITLLGRSLVQFQKYGVNRQRPELEHLVDVRSLSFPSAHAANSMILLLSLAMIVPPRGHRTWAVAAALLGTFLVGISRPMLGVHFPSDVVGGWSFGAAWVLTMLALAERWPARERAAPRR